VKAAEEVRLYESGRVFLPREDSSDLPDEPLMLSAVLAERVSRKTGPASVLRRLKGALEELAAELHRPLRFDTLEVEGIAWAHPIRSAAVFQNGLQIGMISTVHPEIVERLGWQGETAAFEIDLTRLVETEERPQPYRSPAKFPSVRVDLSFLCPFTLRYDALCEQFHQAAPDLVGIELLDEYVAREMQPGQRSLTVRLCFQAVDRTLSDEDLVQQVDAIRSWLAESGASLRGDS
jgi:phenylalanyl-tRNA synthetase beta chain